MSAQNKKKNKPMSNEYFSLQTCLQDMNNVFFFCETQRAPLHFYSVQRETQRERRDLKDNKQRG